MRNNFKFQSNHFMYGLLFVIIIIILLLFFQNYQSQLQQCSVQHKETQNQLKKKINSLEKNLNQVQSQSRQVSSSPRIENYQSDIILPNVATNNLINKNPQTLNALDRIYNPLRYPYKSDYFYDQNWYPNLNLPSQVVGCGGRNTPCLGGTQVPIYNPPNPVNISDNNIAPVYISTRGPLGEPQQVGILYKVYGDENDTLPLFGRRNYPNERTWTYYTMLGNYGAKVPIVTKNKHEELGTNDVVFMKGRKEPYRATIYESDFPQYIPYL